MTEQSAGLARERRVRIESRKGGRTVRIAQITDLHISAVNDRDMACGEIARTYLHRKWNRDGASIPAARAALDVCREADRTVITGDLLDYYSSEGAAELRRLFDEYSNVTACIGGHDVTLEMETGYANALPLEKRYALLREFWCNDVQFAAETVEDKVTLIALNNNTELWRETRSMFDGEQLRLLRAELETARRERRIVLLFMHEPLFPGRDTAVYDLFTGQAVPFRRTSETGTGKEGYDLITSSADVVRGVFVGHLHCDFETEIEAGYERDGAFVRQNIPMYGLTTNCYGTGGHVLWIDVE